MALQGTIDTFPLTDVLTLVASSARSGRLTLSGDRGVGRLWIDKDMVVAGELADDRVVSPERAVFELLRFTDGAFEFESVSPESFPDLGTTPVPTEDCLTQAAGMIREWERTKDLVPSGAHRVCLVPDLPDDEITIDAATWRTLVTITRSSSVDHLAVELGIDDYECAVLVARLIGGGLVEINEPWDLDALLAEGVTAGSAAEDADDGDPWVRESIDQEESDGAGSGGHIRLDEPGSPIVNVGRAPIGATDSSLDDSMAPMSDFPDHFPIDDLIPDVVGGEDDAWVNQPIDGTAQHYADPTFPIDVPAANGTVPSSDAHEEGYVDNGDPFVTDDVAERLGTDEVLRQMATLSPSAAEAVAATLAGDVGTEDTPDDARSSRRGRGLFRGSGLFGVQRVDPEPEHSVVEESDRVDVDPFTAGDPLGDPDFLGPDATDVEADVAVDGTSISYLDSF